MWEQLSCEGGLSGFEWFSTFEKYEAAHIALFDVGIPEPPVPLFESAHDKSRPAQELVLENTYFYDVFGLRIDPQPSVPDHLLTQLEFLSTVAYARDHACDGSQACDMARLELDYLERHLLDWTNRAERKLHDCPFSNWDVLFSLMTCRLRQRHQKLKAQMTLPQP